MQNMTSKEFAAECERGITETMNSCGVTRESAIILRTIACAEIIADDVADAETPFPETVRRYAYFRFLRSENDRMNAERTA